MFRCAIHRDGTCIMLTRSMEEVAKYIAQWQDIDEIQANELKVTIGMWDIVEAGKMLRTDCVYVTTKNGQALAALDHTSGQAMNACEIFDASDDDVEFWELGDWE